MNLFDTVVEITLKGYTKVPVTVHSIDSSRHRC
jgi:hypothetical protein